jgi:tetratricopeptide (TPR) repeat protein
MTKRMTALVVCLTIVGIGVWSGIFAFLHFYLSRRADPPVVVKQPQNKDEWRKEVAEAIQKPIRVDANLLGDLEAFFRDLGAAIRARDEGRVRGHFNTRRMGEEIFRHVAIPDHQRPGFLRGFEDGFHRAFGPELEPLGGGRQEIKSVKLLAAGDELAVIVRHRDVNGESSRIRWWLSKRTGSWRIYDLEDLDVGLRMTTFAAALVPDAAKGNLAWAVEARAIAEVRQAILAGDRDKADQILKRIAPVRFPKEIEGCRWLIHGSLKLDRGNPAEALVDLDKAAEFNPDMPALDLIRAWGMNGVGQHAKALEHVAKYAALLGEDNETYHHAGVALAGLGRRDEALDRFHKALKDEPNSPGTLGELRKILPAGKKGELAEHFQRLTFPGRDFFNLADAAWKAYDLEAVEVLAKAMRERNAEEPDAAYFLARVKGKTGKLDEALALYQAALAQQADGKIREEYVTQLLEDALAAQNPLAGYRAAPDPDFAFRFFVRRLRGPTQAERLRPILEEHSKKRPGDPALVLARAQLHLDNGKPEQAERVFAKVDPTKLDGPNRTDYWAARVDVYIRKGQALAAYTDLKGPRDEIFRRLAGHFSMSNDAKGLEDLLSLHRRQSPADQALPVWEAEAKWLARDDAGLVKVLTDHRQVILADRTQRRKFFDRLIPALYRLRRQEAGRREIAGLLAEGPAAAADVQALIGLALGPQHVDMLEDLGQALRRRKADDPDGLHCLARVRARKNELPEAVRLLKEALAKQPNLYKREDYQRGFLFDLVDAGKLLEGYQAMPDAAFAFRALAEDLLEGGRPEGLGPLLEAHRKKQPDDVWLDYYTAELHMARKEYAKAEEALAAGMARQLDKNTKEVFRGRRVFARFKMGKGMSAYDDFEPKKAVFDQLAWLCVDDKDHRLLTELVARRRQADPADINLPVWEMEAKWLAGDYAAAVALLQKHREGVFAQPGQRWKFQDHLVRGLVRLRRYGEALKEAEAAQKQGENLVLLALGHAAVGDVARTTQLLDGVRHQPFWIASFYRDPDLGPLLRSDRFKALRQKHPEPKGQEPPPI